MSDIVAIVLPVFGLIGLGYLAAYFKWIGERAGEGLSDYVFALAVPALIFKTLSTSGEASQSPWGYWAAYFIGVAVAWGIGMVASRRLIGRSPQEAVVVGFTSAQSNTVLVGIPLILRAYGEPAAVPLFLLIAIHLPIMMTIATLLIEHAAAGESGGRLRLGRLARTLATHPILLALFAGLIAKSMALSPPGPVKQIIDGLAASASPAALVAMGAALARYGFKADPKGAMLVTGLKLFVHPAVVLGMGLLIGLDPVFEGVAVLFAALPSGVNAYLLASRYKTGEAMASASIAMTTALSVLSVAFWLLVLNPPTP